MYYIGICDDYKMYRDDIRKHCDRLFEEMGKEYTCVEFASGEEMLRYDGPRMHILFLDVEMPGMSGIDVMHWLEKTDLVWKIIFVTCYPEFISEAFGMKTLAFITKPVEYRIMSMWVNMAIREYEIRAEIMDDELNKEFQFNLNEGTCRIGLKDVVYIEGARNYCYLKRRTRLEKELISGHLKAWEQKMQGTSMLRIHKSLLINMSNIKNMQSGKVVMITGEEFKIGRFYLKTVETTYKDFRKYYCYDR